MACIIKTEEKVKKIIESHLRPLQIGSREAIREIAHNLNDGISMKGVFYPEHHIDGSYRLAFNTQYLSVIIQKIYIQEELEDAIIINEYIEEKAQGNALPEDIPFMLSEEEIKNLTTGSESKESNLSGNQLEIPFENHTFTNKKELSKGLAGAESVISQLYTENFKDFFPDYEMYQDWEKERLINAVISGQIKITCKL